VTSGSPDPPGPDPAVLPAADEARIRTSFGAQTMLATLGATMAEVRSGRVVLEMPYDPRFGQQFGYTHAGAITALVDTACGYAALSVMPTGREVLTVDFSANFVAPASGERFRATATVLRAGRALVVARGEVHAVDDGRQSRLIAAMQATMMAVAPPAPLVEPGA
jgi:uncharacterized protein (TIGR00369 family)